MKITSKQTRAILLIGSGASLLASAAILALVGSFSAEPLSMTWLLLAVVCLLCAAGLSDYD